MQFTHNEILKQQSLNLWYFSCNSESQDITKRGCVRAADFFPPEYLRWCQNNRVQCCQNEFCNEGWQQEVVENKNDDGTRSHFIFSERKIRSITTFVSLIVLTLSPLPSKKKSSSFANRNDFLFYFFYTNTLFFHCVITKQTSLETWSISFSDVLLPILFWTRLND